MLVYLIRHGHGAHVGKRLPSRESPLSTQGHEEAEALVARFEGLQITAVYSSPYERCLDTIRPLAKDRKLRITKVDGLKDVQYGDLAGKALKGLRGKDIWQHLLTWPTSIRFPNGESLLECHARVQTAFQGVIERHDRSDSIVVASHGDPIRFLVAHHLGVHPDTYRRISIDPVGVSVLDIHPGWVQVRRVNEVGGLTDLAPPVEEAKNPSATRTKSSMPRATTSTKSSKPRATTSTKSSKPSKTGKSR